jgi:regulatory protein
MKKSNPIPENIAINRLMQLCSRSEKSSSDIRKKLSEWGLENRANPIIKRLTEEKYIDDARFAAAFIHDKIFINKWGKIKAKFMLRSQQISNENIDNALATIYDKSYREMIFGELQKKRLSLKKNTSFHIKSKLYAFGMQRGYEPDLIRRYIESIQL